jgi:hypothetical protein
MDTKTRSAEIARRAIQTVVTTPGCNKKQSAEGVDPDKRRASFSAPQAAPRAGPGLIKGVIRSGLPQIYKILLVRKR